jgi:rRNA maturation endonuclease Nob1
MKKKRCANKKRKIEKNDSDICVICGNQREVERGGKF